MEQAKSQVGPRGISQIAIPLCLPQTQGLFLLAFLKQKKHKVSCLFSVKVYKSQHHNSNLTLAHSLELEREKGGGILREKNHFIK